MVRGFNQKPSIAAEDKIVVVCCLLFVVCCLLFVVCCLLFVVCCLFVVVCWVGIPWLLFDQQITNNK